MGSLRALEARLARLEARVAAIPDPEEQEARHERLILHLDAWFIGGCFEDIPEKNRDASMWEFVLKYGPVYLEMVWEGIVDGREELLAAGVDFTRVEGVDEDDVAAVRPYGAPGPSTPSKLWGNFSLTPENE